ncbi:hypothetical protein V7S43_002056 [Phytophthora oleae]|uniref:Beta-catenin-like protein 1 N-terminal domain-containing protein n=1 Tax=Phytophthora oleae TaxID=2107226 RepID=A0ABD3G2R4_9STRA
MKSERIEEENAVSLGALGYVKRCQGEDRSTCDLFAKYNERVERNQNDEDVEEEDTESRNLRHLDAGLFVLERIAFVVAHLCHFTKKLRAYVMIKFHERSIGSERLTTILREQLDLLVADDAVKEESEEANAKDSKDVVNEETKEAQKNQLRALLDTLEGEEAEDEEVENAEAASGAEQK